MRLYFVLRPQVFQLVPRQRLTQVVRPFFDVQLPVIQPLFYSPLLSSSSRIFQSSFSSFPIRFRLCCFSLLLFFTSLQLFGLFFIHNNTVLFSRLRPFLPKNIFLFGKKPLNTVSGLFYNQISFCCKLFTRAKFSYAAREEAVDDINKYIYIYKLDVRLDSLAFPVIRD